MNQQRKKRNRRRYYLHRKLKGVAGLNTRLKAFHVSDVLLGGVSERDRAYIAELIREYGYVIQIIIN